MPTLVMPDGVPVLGATSVCIVQSIASMVAPDLSSEINATSSVDASLYLNPAGWGPAATSNKGTRPPRLGSKTQRETFNRTTYSLSTLQYVYDPQADNTASANAVKAALAPGTTVYLVERLGLDAELVAWAATQKVRVHKVTLGDVQSPSGDRTDDNAEFLLMQDAIYANLEGPVDGALVA